MCLSGILWQLHRQTANKKEIKEVLYMDRTKKDICDMLYRQLDIRTDGKLSDACTEEEFYEEFKEALYDFSLIPTVAIIE